MGVAATYRGLLRNGPLTRLLLGEFVSSIGDWLYLVALVVLVFRETGDPVVLGVVGAVRMLPYVVLSIPAGLIADRFDRRLVLLVTDLARAGCMLGMAWLVAGGAPLWSIAALAVIAACFSTFFYPAIGALIPSLVRDEREFGPANSAWATLDNFAWIVGPGIAGVLLATGDIALAFVLNALSFTLIAAILWTLPEHRPGTAADTATAPTGLPAAADAPRAIAGDPSAAGDSATAQPGRAGVRVGPGRWVPASIDLRAVSGLVVIDGVTWFTFGGISILIVVIAVDVFHGGDAATGYLNAAIGIGGTVGALLSGALVLRPRLGRPLLLGAAAFGCSTVLLGIADQLPVAFLAIAVVSIGNLVMDVARTTIFQRVVPDDFRGRFGGVMMTTQTLAESLGTLIVPFLVTGLGFGVVMGLSGLLVIGATIAAVALIGGAADMAEGAYDLELRRIARLPLFGGLSPARVESALRKLQPLTVAAGDVIVHQGQPADRFYVIVTGGCEVTQLGPDGASRHVRTLGPDSVFGERGLIARAPRSATVTASTGSLLFVMDGQAFLRLVGVRPAVRDRMMALYDEPPAEVIARG